MEKPLPRYLDGNLSPLNTFLKESGDPGLEVEWIKANEMQEPYRTLLEHQTDMTSTLEKHHGDEIILKILALHDNGTSLRRKVLLVLEENEKTVEFGAIRIFLEHFPDKARGLILGCRIPLGNIMDRFKLPHQNSPTRYFRIQAERLTGWRLALPENTWLFGRCNTITNSHGETMAEVVEILPPQDGDNLSRS